MPGFNIEIPADVKAQSRNCNKDGKEQTLQDIFRTLELPSNNIETARAHRWKLEISRNAFGRGSPNTIYSTTNTVDVSKVTTYVKSCQRPTFEVDVITIHHQGEEIYRPGKYRWNTIDVVFYEYMEGKSSYTNRTAEYIYQWWFNNFALDHRQDSVRALNSTTMTIYELDGSGQTSREYKLYNVIPIKSSLSDLDHSSSEINTSTITFRYNYAIESEGSN